jgi:hypothetical protein
MLHITAAAAFSNNSTVIGAFDGYYPVTIKSMMDIQCPFGVVQVTSAAVGAGPNRHAVAQINLASWRLRRMRRYRCARDEVGMLRRSGG